MLAEIADKAAGKAATTMGSMPSQTGWELVGNTLFSLLLIVGLLFGLAWLLKRSPLAKTRAGMALEVKGGARLGAREKLVVVRYHDRELLLGVTPGQITLLTGSSPDEAFGDALRAATERSDDNA